MGWEEGAHFLICHSIRETQFCNLYCFSIEGDKGKKAFYRVICVCILFFLFWTVIGFPRRSSPCFQATWETSDWGPDPKSDPVLPASAVWAQPRSPERTGGKNVELVKMDWPAFPGIPILDETHKGSVCDTEMFHTLSCFNILNFLGIYL